MKTQLPLLSLGLLLSIAVASLPALADEADQDGEPSIKERLEQAVGWYDLLPDEEAKEPMRAEVVMRWQNPIRTQTGAGVLAVWISRGRPEAMASIFQWDDDLCHEFGSLSRAGGLVARDKSGPVWSPQAAGVEFRDVSDAPAPAATRAARLRQMKSLAERFTARLPDRTSDDANRVVLRLLPTPLYRYAPEEAEDAAASLKDGALFAFAMGTDPEVILLLEAVEREGKSSWQFAFARGTGWGAEASLGEKVVWSVPTHKAQDPKGNLMQVRRALK